MFMKKMSHTIKIFSFSQECGDTDLLKKCFVVKNSYLVLENNYSVREFLLVLTVTTQFKGHFSGKHL